MLSPEKAEEVCIKFCTSEKYASKLTVYYLEGIISFQSVYCGATSLALPSDEASTAKLIHKYFVMYRTETC